ncbi:AI-2E family transporter [Arthrobacter alpinus]|nr:AI-2E family transporter [Arthrobacter alpinus]
MFEYCRLSDDVDLRALRLSDASALATAYVRNRDHLALWNPVHPEEYYTEAWLEHHILQPLLMGKVLHIHGLSILLALAAGTTLAGLIGALLAVPLTAVGWSIIKIWTGRESLATTSPDTPAAAVEPPGAGEPRLPLRWNSFPTAPSRNHLRGGALRYVPSLELGLP